jgi:hypothetical protein
LHARARSRVRERLELVLRALGAPDATPNLPTPRLDAIAIANRLAEHVLQREGYPLA